MSNWANAAMVLAANMSATIRLGESSHRRIPATTWVASTESPPRAKKSSCTPTASLARPRMSATMRRSAR
ncbi:Uncharacterised protein [Mycobacterium tuberculosis]|uniref:Uncharacterized protein n=1 Tax=Mycobacterium tuberculosis TaxID=1773 RepID=A0A916P8I2_MYCTX|nr:Uncharacterised protein [Mycobacterium tuberculosis]